MRYCGYCDKPLKRRPGEKASKFATRSHCDKKCAALHRPVRKARRAFNAALMRG